MSDIFWTQNTPSVSPSADAYIPVRVRGTNGADDTFAQISLPEALGGVQPADLGALRATSAYAFPTGSVKKEALFAALGIAGHLSDLIDNQPPLFNPDGSTNDAGRQLQFAFTLLPTDAGALFIRDRYYAGDDAGFAALFAAAGSGSTTPGTVTTAAVVHDVGPSVEAVMSQAGVTEALGNKPDHFPAQPHMPLATGLERLTDGWYRHFYNNTELHIRPTDGSGGPNTGLPDTVTQPSSWQGHLGFIALYCRWRLAKIQGDAGRVAEVKNQMAGHWAYYQSKFTPDQIKSGLGGIINASDDASLHAIVLTIVHEVIGDANGLAYAIEAIAATNQRFHDPNQTQIDYGVTTAGGIAFKSDPNGILYFPPDNPYRINTTQELVTARAALYISQQPTTSTLTSAMKTAMFAYAKNTWAWAFTLARASNGKTNPIDNQPADAIYFGSCYLSAATGPLLKGERFFNNCDAPIRGQSAYADGMTLAMANLSIKLYRITNDPKYLVEAQAIEASYVASNGFGRSAFGGVPLIANARDPWINGSEVAPYVFANWFDGAQAGVPTTGLNTALPLAAAIYNTGQVICTAIADGLSTPDWVGDEYCPGTGYSRWTDEGGAGGQGGDPNQDYGATAGGGQAAPRQIMTSSTILVLAQAARALEPYVQKLGSGVIGAQAIERLPARMAALEVALSLLMPRSGGYFSDKFGLDTQFYLSRNANPFINMANGGLVSLDRTSNQWNFYTQGSIRFTINSLGAVAIGAFTANGSIKSGRDNTDSAGEPAYRFSVIYAGTGAINTSDETEKTIRGPLTVQELAAAREIAKSTIVFQFDDAVSGKGLDKARLHIGYGAQTVFGILTDHGLDPHRYAFCCFDQWDADAGEQATEAGPEGSGIFATPGRPARAAGQRYGLRMDELHAFIAAAQEQRLTALETPHA